MDGYEGHTRVNWRVTAAAQIQTLADALVATGWRLWTTAHSNTSAAQLVFQWMSAVAPGHVVLEITSVTRASAMDRVGVLLSIKSSREYTIRTIDGRGLRWENATFVRIPRNEADDHEIFLLGQQTA